MASRQPALLFVYGTLRPAGRHRRARQLLREALPLGPARVRYARLFRVRDYPALVIGGGRRTGVTGDLLALRRPAYSLAWIDAYEGCDPAGPFPPTYRRGPVRVIHRGRARIATGYAWIAPIAGLRRIASGDWQRPR